MVGISVRGKAQFPSGTMKCRFVPSCTAEPTGKIPRLLKAIKKKKKTEVNDNSLKYE